MPLPLKLEYQKENMSWSTSIYNMWIQKIIVFHKKGIKILLSLEV
jgi:hypothetical protein